MKWKSAIDKRRIKVISLDVTGTLLIHKFPIVKTYVEAADWANLRNPPTVAEFGPAYKQAYRENSIQNPCFGYGTDLKGRTWWADTAKRALEHCGRGGDYYSQREFERWFRRVYQHFGSYDGYELLDDAVPFLKWAYNQKNPDDSPRFILGIISNTPMRTVETVLPMFGLQKYFKWYICSEDKGFEKPDRRMYDEAFRLSCDWLPGLTEKRDVLHIGDNLATDFCGSKVAGFQALHLDRRNNPRVTIYQDWLKCDDYPDKSEDDIAQCTVPDFEAIRKMLELQP